MHAAAAPVTPAPETPIVPLDPMLASAMTGRRTFDDYLSDDYRLEVKLDGHRIVVHKRGDAVVAFSRRGIVRALPVAVVRAVRMLPDGIYDGELLAPAGKSWAVTVVATRAALSLVLFDVVEVLGVSIAARPYAERRAALEMAVAHVVDSVAVQIVPSVPVSREALAAIYAAGGEGAVIKRTTSTYRPGYRTPEWIKVVPARRAVLTIVGYEAGSFGPYATTVLAGDDGVVTKVKTKDTATREAIAADPAHMIGRRLVISYRERTPSGSFRHPMADHLAGEGE